MLLVLFFFCIEGLMLYNFICSYVVAGYRKNELDRKAIYSKALGKDVDGRVLIFQFLLTVNLFIGLEFK